MLSRPTRFNHVVGLGLQFVRYTQGVKYTLLNVLVLAAPHLLTLVCDATTPSDVIKVCNAHLISWIGLPGKHVVENVSEFGADILAHTGDNGIYQNNVFIVEAPWEHGMVERHVQVWADIIQATVSETSASGQEQTQLVLLMASLAMDRIFGNTVTVHELWYTP